MAPPGGAVAAARCRSSAWSSTRSPARPSSEAIDNWRELDRRWSTPRRPGASSTGSYGWEVSPVLWKKVMPKLSAGPGAERRHPAGRRARAGPHGLPLRHAGGTCRPRSTPTARRSAPTCSRVDGTPRRPGQRLRRRPPASSAEPTCSCSTRPAPAGWPSGWPTSPYAVTQRRVASDFTQRPSPPFITSTLQQEAGRKLRFTAPAHHAVAQRLYERGFITYMRTDSTNLSEQAVTAARGPDRRSSTAPTYLPDAPRTYPKKVKNAQEAHEAIRPAGDAFRTPDEVRGRARRRRAAPLRPRLEAHRRLARWPTPGAGGSPSASTATSTAGERGDVRRLGPHHRVPRLPAGLRRGRRRPRRRARGPRGPPAAARRGRPRSPRGPSTRRRPRDPAARPLHRGQPRQGAGGAGHRPAVHLRQRHLDHPGPRLRVEEGHGARADVDVVRRRQPARAALRRARRLRLHGPHGGGPRRDRPRRAGVRAVAAALLLRQRLARPPRPGQRAAPRDRRPRAVDRSRSATTTHGNPVVLRVGQYGPYVQRGDQTGQVPADVAPDELTVDDGRRAHRAPERARPGARRRPRDRPARHREGRPLRPLRAARRAGRGLEEAAEDGPRCSRR